MYTHFDHVHILYLTFGLSSTLQVGLTTQSLCEGWGTRARAIHPLDPGLIALFTETVQFLLQYQILNFFCHSTQAVMQKLYTNVISLVQQLTNVHVNLPVCIQKYMISAKKLLTLDLLEGLYQCLSLGSFQLPNCRPSKCYTDTL